ncbi:MAG: WD40/YVTN/BNR-like repeat-containing protein [Candidatus Aminicenantales bacterium]
MCRRNVFILLMILFLLAVHITALAEEKANPLLLSWNHHLKLRESSLFRLEWILLGPVMNSARVESVQAHPALPGTIYVAFGSGNLWKTEDSGLSWKPIFENQSALGIGDIALAPSDPEIIWLGSGESLKKARNFTLPGTGVFRSDDGGKTWKNMGLHDSHHIGEIAVHPRNPDVVFVAVLGHFWTPNRERGIYRTLDGGKTWEHVLYVNERTGANDVVISPSNPDVIYASLWENYPGIAGRGSGVYRSSDGGRTWKRLSGGFPQGAQTGRIGLAVSWSNPDKVYALVDNLNRPKNLAAEVYRTLDGGETWSRTHSEDLHIFPGIGWYFADCYLNPRDDEEIYALGVRIAHSQDGGKTFELMGGDVYHLFPNPAETLHLDHCEMWVNPENPRHLILGNDGGLYVSYNGGNSWLHLNNIPAGEFYDISVDNQDPYFVYGGTQDDSSVYGPSKEWNPRFPDGWKYVWLDAWSGGDGCVTLPDPEDAGTVYFSSQHGAIRRKDMKTGRSKPIRPRLPEGSSGKMTYAFVSPYFISPHNHLTLYHAGNYVFKSMNRGETWWLVSPDLSQSSLKKKKSTAITALAESPLKPGLLYAGTDRGAFWVSEDDGRHWMERSSGLPDYYLRSICPSRFSLSRVYAAVTGINDDVFSCFLFVSEDSGQHWKSIKANLPDEVAYVILEDPVNENILYVGLYRGVYVSVDRGQSWSLLGPDLPAVCISDLVVQEREMDLVAGTHGRGIYKMNIRPVQEAFKSGPPEKNILFGPPPARLPVFGDTHHQPLYITLKRVPFTFFLMEDMPVEIIIAEGKGKTVWARQFSGRRGFNQIRWDLVVERVKSPLPYFIHYDRFIKPGIYDLILRGEGFELKQKLKVVNPVQKK